MSERALAQALHDVRLRLREMSEAAPSDRTLLRTLSIKNPDALYRRNRRQPWGEPYWRRVNLRKQFEWTMRQRRGMAVYHLVPVETAPAEPPLPGEIPLDSAKPVTH